ncbi:hypothetical protein [Lacticaseibacillus thailandensis]|uniref:Uncharacterized protein n=1 Tax=Lacticaseibacillus thailandensis DSM 22698 = JCM 13996 TaxID=1423810 RepID=A0A0R2CGJ7_9LACO|nr:hypothetical protein [Lacticaseibacillus thailandensis]KRM87593.1 hypothetical protein FD19_GL001106 [Lacticaseibacillus thailandensis DSM 22698 = JCM 13996]
MIRFWGQAKFTASDGKLAGYELFLRERSQRDGEWYLPSDFGQFKVSALDDLLGATFAGMPSDLLLVSLNLDEEQFADPEYYTQLGVCQRKGGPRLIVELTERLGTGANTVTH